MVAGGRMGAGTVDGVANKAADEAAFAFEAAAAGVEAEAGAWAPEADPGVDPSAGPALD